MKKQLETLVASEAWGLLADWGEKQLQHRRDNAIQPVNGLDEAITKEYDKGEIAGLSLFFHLPYTLIEEMDRLMEQSDLSEETEE